MNGVASGRFADAVAGGASFNPSAAAAFAVCMVLLAGCASFGEPKRYALARLRSDTNTAIVSMIGGTGLCRCPPFTMTIYPNGDAVLITGPPDHTEMHRLRADAAIAATWPARIEGLRVLADLQPCEGSEGEITILYRMNGRQQETNCCTLGRYCRALIDEIHAATGAKEMLAR